MTDASTGTSPAVASKRVESYWNRRVRFYDVQTNFVERCIFGDTRQWVCTRAQGQILEVAIGTGLNLQHYSRSTEIVAQDCSPIMLAAADLRARRCGKAVKLLRSDAQDLPFPDLVFDTVLATFAMCAIANDRLALEEMVRVLRPGGILLLADHVRSTNRLARAAQGALERATIRIGGSHFRRRPFDHLKTLGMVVEEHDRFFLGIAERVAARKPGST